MTIASMPRTFAVLMALSFSPALLAGDVTFPLRVSDNGRHLVDQKGEPFLYHADTPWHIFTRLNKDEVRLYLDKRAAQGFSAIQTQLLPEAWKTNDIHGAGEPPLLTTDDLTTPNEKYFAHVEWVVRQAGERGIVVAMNPAWLGCCEGGWRDKLKTNGVTKCHEYGRYLGRRFKTLNNVVWLHGGDRDPGKYIEEVRAIAKGIKEFARHQLATAHASSTHSSLDVYPKDAWLDFNATYTYAAEHVGAWRRQFHVYHSAKIDYLREPPMPAFLVESTYEKEHRASQQKIRRQAYWAYLSGACGHALGNGLIWPFKPGWQNELDSPASQQMSHLGALLRSFRWHELVPDFDHKLVTAGYGTFNSTNQPGGDDYVTPALARDGTFALAYLPTNTTLTVDLSKFRGPVSETWFDPVNGARNIEANVFKNSGPRKFSREMKNAGGDSDWVLALEVAGMKPEAK